MTDHDPHDLAAAYALDALEHDERIMFEAHSRTCETCTAELAAYRETAAQLATDLQPPPEGLEASIVRAIAGVPQVSPDGSDVVTDLGARRHRRKATRLLQTAAAVALFAAGLLIGTARTGDNPTTAGEVEYAGGIGVDDVAIGQLTVTATGIGRVVDLETDELPILPTGEYYELWFVGPGDTAENPDRISAGTFHPDADGNVGVRFAAAVDPSLYPTVEITAEPGDGDPAATGPIVASITIDP